MKKQMVIFVVLVMVGAWGTIAYNIKMSKKPTLTFGVIGDIHTDTVKLDKIIKDYKEINKDMDALVMNGDIVNEGREEEYKEIEKTIGNNKENIPKFLIRNIGNHEFITKGSYPNSREDNDRFKDLYYQYSGESKPYHNKWIGGYNFISLGSEETNTGMVSEVNAYISQTQKSWLKEKLKEDYKEGRPIFVFLHQNIWGDPLQIQEDGSEPLKDILSKYKEVIVINSHTHEDVERKNVFRSYGMNMVTTGAVQYTIDSYIGNKPSNKNFTKTYGIYIEVYKNKVKIQGRDFENNKWIYTRNLP